jgi:hypothetical protein
LSLNCNYGTQDLQYVAPTFVLCCHLLTRWWLKVVNTLIEAEARAAQFTWAWYPLAAGNSTTFGKRSAQYTRAIRLTLRDISELWNQSYVFRHWKGNNTLWAYLIFSFVHRTIWWYFYIYMYVPITVAALSKAWTVFVHSNTGIVGSNTTWGMDICVRLFCVCIVLCAGSGLATGWSPVQGVLPTV